MKRLPFVCVLIVASSALCFGQNFYYPHVANGVLGGTVWKTTIFLINPAATGTATASGSVSFYRENATVSQAGSPFDISFVNEAGQPVGSGNTIPFQIAGG